MKAIFRLLNRSRFLGSKQTFLSFEKNTGQASYKRYFLPQADIKGYNVMIDGRNVFDQPVKNNLAIYDNIRKIPTGQGDDYTTGCLLDYPYFKNLIYPYFKN